MHVLKGFIRNWNFADQGLGMSVNFGSLALHALLTPQADVPFHMMPGEIPAH
jgi:hypothetical protein